MSARFQTLVEFIRSQYRTNDPIALHVPQLGLRERQCVVDAVDSTFVSSVGQYVNRFEREICAYTGSPDAVAVVNGTAALHLCLKLAGVQAGDLVLTQALSFVATCNAVAYCQADPVFLDVDANTLGLSPVAVQSWLQEHAELGLDGLCRTKTDQRVVRACLPMHTFGHPVDLDALRLLCESWHLVLVEDAAESLGSLYKGRHTGTYGRWASLSFNGNKIITTGGGGMVLCGVEDGLRARHISTTAKRNHPWEYDHDELGYNYRMPNLNAALGCAQLEHMEKFVAAKRKLAACYKAFFQGSNFQFVQEPAHARSNYWLNAILCESQDQRDDLLKFTHAHGVLTRPAWKLLHRLPAFAHCRRDELTVAKDLEDRLLNLPSSVPPEACA